MADQRLGIHAAEFLFAHRERHHRHVGRLQAGVAQFLVERHVGVAVDGGDHRCLLAFGGELLDLGDDGLIVAMTEGGVVLHDVRVGHALRLEEGAQDLVGGARIHVVGAQQHEALGLAAVLAHQVFHGRNRLLVGRRAGVEDVLLEFFTLVLHRVEQQAVEFLVHRQHRLAGHRSPAAEGHRHLVLGQQLAGLFGEQRPVGGRVHHHRFELLAHHATGLVDLVDGHQRGFLQRRFGNGHRAGQRMQDSDLDRVGRVGRKRGRQADGCHGRRQDGGLDEVATSAHESSLEV